MIQLRKAAKKDIPLLATMLREVQTTHSQQQADFFCQPTEHIAYQQYFEELLPKEDFSLWVASKDDQLLGYVLTSIKQITPNPFRKAMTYSSLEQICVQPNAQQQGIGTLLLNKALQDAENRGATKTTLMTWSFNQKAHDFFRKHGFQTSSLLMDFSHSNEKIND